MCSRPCRTSPGRLAGEQNHLKGGAFQSQFIKRCPEHGYLTVRQDAFAGLGGVAFHPLTRIGLQNSSRTAHVKIADAAATFWLATIGAVKRAIIGFDVGPGDAGCR